LGGAAAGLFKMDQRRPCGPRQPRLGEACVQCAAPVAGQQGETDAEADAGWRRVHGLYIYNLNCNSNYIAVAKGFWPGIERAREWLRVAGQQQRPPPLPP